ncbi:hypothetical protein CPT03_03390 [Pedobacter ginsengisoli]|jgi:AcrR family transcriptional regulator|uniref:HTH cro/C1-type domain-containing protein n=1 Tax=Pedobacter ginsengisoli TaxID=363852 RepID=A0A2D1U232_9SPHI|nr:hypothetical protein [Pedobacter ginsengisoli]ATP55574.1 hypothetical protein CPT03_03390 [Pedobacter ginsengisoli]
MEVYVGEILERAVRRQEISISEVSRRMKVSRRTLYNWFEQRTLDKSLLSAVGRIINHDFSKELGEDLSFSDDQPGKVDKTHLKLSDPSLPEEHVHYWMRKYIVLLEEYNQLTDKIEL